MAQPGRQPSRDSEGAASGYPDSGVSYEQYYVLIDRSIIEFREKDILAMRAERRVMYGNEPTKVAPAVITLDAQLLSFDEGVVLTLIGEFAQAYEVFAVTARRTMSGSKDSMHYTPTAVLTFMAISIANLHSNSGFWQGIKLRSQMRRLRRRLSELAKVNRDGVYHKMQFIDALTDVMKHKPFGSVAARMEDAIFHAKLQHDVKDEACISEYLGRYLLAHHCPTMAASAMLAARDAYQKWGLTAKAREMEALYQVSPMFFSQERR